jgi:pimeloyl-ACP methyl ester carboxylesterase
MIYESITSNAAFQRHPPPGEFIDAGGYRLHLNILGENSGKPTVVLESGAMSMSVQWGWVMDSIAEHTQVVAYDRPGMGWSDPSPSQIEADELVEHLRQSLRSAGLEGPYILVGHSMGGLISRLFAQMYPQEVAGLVLVDPRDLEWHAPTITEIQIQSAIISALSRVGLIRLTGLAAQDASGLPPGYYEQAVDIYPSHRHLRNTGRDAYIGNSAADLLLAEEDLSRFSLLVLTAPEPDSGIPSPLREEINERHAALAARSPHGRQILVPGAGHVSIVTHEDHAGYIVSAIIELLENGNDQAALP